jgi:hypothetical protein
VTAAASRAYAPGDGPFTHSHPPAHLAARSLALPACCRNSVTRERRMEPDTAAAAEAFGLALRELREQAGLTLRELGRRACTTTPASRVPSAARS